MSQWQSIYSVPDDNETHWAWIRVGHDNGRVMAPREISWDPEDERVVILPCWLQLDPNIHSIILIEKPTP